MEGSVRVEGLDTRESDVGVLAQKVGYVYQDFETDLSGPPCWTMPLTPA